MEVTGRKNNPRSYKKYLSPSYGYDFSNLKYPVTQDQICDFEKRNPKFAINIFKISACGGRIIPYRISKFVLRQRKDISLLLIEDENKGHYTWIKNPDILLKTSYNNR